PALVIPSLTDHQRARLAALGDGLIAAVAPLPGAGTLVVERNLVAKVLSRRPDLGAPLVRALAADTAGQLQALAAADPEAWSALVTVVAGGYYTEADVKERIGYDGQVASPLQPDGYPAYISEGPRDHLLDGTWEATWQGGLRKSSAIAATCSGATMSRLILRHAPLLDGLNPPRPEMTLVIDGERLHSVGSGQVEAAPGDQVFDLKGMTVMPGMINTHYHATYQDIGPGALPVGMEAPPALQTLRAARNL